MRFQDFELEISVDDEHGYAVAVVHSPAGETQGAFELPFSSLELEKYILELQNALLRSSGSMPMLDVVVTSLQSAFVLFGA